MTILLDQCRPLSRTEKMDTMQAAERVTSYDITSPVSLPGFDRAAMDGFAVRSRDTKGARPSAPNFLDDFLALRTGMEVPEAYDAVVMLEDAQLRGNVLEITAEAHAYKNVSRVGEDVLQGDVIFREGHRLRPPDLAMLSALGVARVTVYARPKVVIIPTGGELVDIGARALRAGEAYEINGLMARLYAEKWGADARKTRDRS